MNEYILQVKNLKTWFKLDTGTLKAVDDVTFSLKRNETIGIIGEYIGKIYLETKARPKYIIEKVLR